MSYDKDLVAAKLRRWEKFLENYSLPSWDEIPNFGLYMEQVVTLLYEYVDYLPPELKDEQVVTPSAINNYVRTKVMPEPVKKRYYRIHIAYLIMICTLKQTLSISLIQKIIPTGIDESEVKKIYSAYVSRHGLSSKAFIHIVRLLGADILNHEEENEFVAKDTSDLIFTVALMGGFSKLLADKLILLEGKDINNGGSIEIEQGPKD